MPELDWKAETRLAYDTVATDYDRLLRNELDSLPWERGILAAFAELTIPQGRPVMDLGCGTGRIARFLADRGVNVRGVDLSPGMIEVARAAHPDMDFAVGSLESLEAEDGSCAGALAWYSIIHAPSDALPGIFAEMYRVLAPGGYVLLAFQVGSESLSISRAYGREVSFTVNRLDPQIICAMLETVGFIGHARSVRQPGPLESTPQAYVLMRKPEHEIYENSSSFRSFP